MPKEYEVGERYYLPVTVKSICPGYQYPIELRFIDSNLCDTDDTTSIADEPDLLLTAEDIALVINTERDDALEELKSSNEELKSSNEELESKLAEFNDTIGKQSDKLRELQARIVELNEVNSSLGENRDALNDEAAVHMTSIHNLQVAVEVLAEKIFEMRCEQDG